MIKHRSYKNITQEDYYERCLKKIDVSFASLFFPPTKWISNRFHLIISKFRTLEMLNSLSPIKYLTKVRLPFSQKMNRRSCFSSAEATRTNWSLGIYPPPKRGGGWRWRYFAPQKKFESHIYKSTLVEEEKRELELRGVSRGLWKESRGLGNRGMELNGKCGNEPPDGYWPQC